MICLFIQVFLIGGLVYYVCRLERLWVQDSNSCVMLFITPFWWNGAKTSSARITLWISFVWKRVDAKGFLQIHEIWSTHSLTLLRQQIWMLFTMSRWWILTKGDIMLTFALVPCIPVYYYKINTTSIYIYIHILQ